ncbi:hypothetical protein FHS51_002167 [Sphingobium wenxiniae]|jgi:hypothetical protein|uniref:Uncharacterized protein n=2 Tax=Sphingobium TaxID=165695 RepID=T0G427_9SPHN|nr:hypothetical protein L485_17235 [Sphingobium baderi LL03]KMS61558.1 hypothetical protein V475_13215 [Sphingobium baderi LL03]MBB6191935.1 hypothetical protein [Sphingobium wenxiniae]TWH96640.1 hypothetical protein IQ35_00571 [Sphingobium wenxiniae]
MAILSGVQSAAAIRAVAMPHFCVEHGWDDAGKGAEEMDG